MRLHLSRIPLLAILLGACWTAAAADGFVRTPLPPGHPLIGNWKVDLPQYKCSEHHTIREDGTASIAAGQEQAESELTVDAQPRASGYYKWIDKNVKDNGKPDCTGSLTPVGDVAVNYIRFHPNGDSFLMCSEENPASCFAEYRRR